MSQGRKQREGRMENAKEAEEEKARRDWKVRKMGREREKKEGKIENDNLRKERKERRKEREKTNERMKN